MKAEAVPSFTTTNYWVLKLKRSFSSDQDQILVRDLKSSIKWYWIIAQKQHRKGVSMNVWQCLSSIKMSFHFDS